MLKKLLGIGDFSVMIVRLSKSGDKMSKAGIEKLYKSPAQNESGLPSGTYW